MLSAMTTVFGSAIACRRAARFGVSPTMPRSCASPDPIRSPTTTSPVAMPTRVCSGAAGLQPADRSDQLQPRPYRPLGIILVRLRIAEIHEHAVAHVLRYEPAEALHGLGDAFLIGGNDLAQVLRVHARGERCRTDEVREHHRDLAALGGVLGGFAPEQSALMFGAADSRDWRSTKLSDRRNIFRRWPSKTPSPQGPDRSGGGEREINAVFSKALGVLGHAEVFEPIRNLLHCGAPSDAPYDVPWEHI